MSPFFRANGKIIFVYVGLAIMVVLRLLDGRLLDCRSTVYAELSGWVFLIVGFTLARRLDERFDFLLRRLVDRGAVTLEEDGLLDLRRSVRNQANIWRWAFSQLFPAVVILSYSLNVDWIRDPSYWVKIGLESVAAFFAGGYAGAVISYGFLGRLLRKHRAEVVVRPTHPDSAGGLRVVGDYYLYQAGMIMLPAIFFAFWFVIGPVWNDAESESRMINWQAELGIFFLLMLAIEIAAFVMPLLFFHDEMLRSSRTNLLSSDNLGKKVVQLKADVLKKTAPDEISSLRSQWSTLEDEIQMLENVPTWPLNAGIRRRFAWWNVLLFVLPFIAKQESVSNALRTTFAPFF